MTNTQGLLPRLRARETDWQRQVDGWIGAARKFDPDAVSAETEAVLRANLYAEAADEIERLTCPIANPSDDKELVELRNTIILILDANYHTAISKARGTADQIIARISTLSSREAVLREALAPFAKLGRLLDGPFAPALFKDEDAVGIGGAWSENGETRTVTFGDLRRAASALSTQAQSGGRDGE